MVTQSNINRNLGVSTTELLFSLGPSLTNQQQQHDTLDSTLSGSSRCTITLRHLGKINDHIAFKVKTTHIQRYIVQPNKGILAPKSTLSLTVLFVKEERKKLWQIREQLGQLALDLGVDALLIQSCVVNPTIAEKLKQCGHHCTTTATTTTELISEGDNKDGYYWKSMLPRENMKIRIRHDCAPSEQSSNDIPGLSAHTSSSIHRPPFVPKPFPTTNAVCCCAHEIKENDNRGSCTKAVVCMSALTGGIVAGCGSFFLGFFPLHLALDSLFRIVLDRGEWVSRLQEFSRESVVVEGQVLRRERKVDDISDTENYFIQLQYDSFEISDDGAVEEDGDSSRFRNVMFSSSIVMHGAKELYERTETSSTVTLKALPGHPSSVIPAFLLEQKLETSLRWAQHFHRLRATLGILVYFGLGFFWLFLFPFYIVLPCLAGAILLLVPFTVTRVREELKLKKMLLCREPSSIPTEYDGYCWFLSVFGPSPSRRVKVIMALVGAFNGLVMSPPGFVILCLAGFLPLISWVSSSRRRKDLQTLMDQGILVRGKIQSGRSERLDDTISYYATIRYALRMAGDAYIFEREFQSERMYNHVGKTIHIVVHPKHPLSGYKKEVVTNMIQKEACYSKLLYPLSLLVSTWAYFFLHWLIYLSGDGVVDPLGTVIFMWIVTAVSPILVIPQILVWGELNYKKSKEDLYSGARVVGFRHTALRHLRGHQNHYIEKAVQIDKKEDSADAEIVKAIPASLEDESDDTLATELTEEESTMASSDMNYFDYNEEDDGHADELVRPMLA